MAKPPIEYRVSRPVSSGKVTLGGMTGKDIDDIKTMTAKKGLSVYDLKPDDVKVALGVLAHKRSVKAAQMRRYRAKKAGKG